MKKYFVSIIFALACLASYNVFALNDVRSTDICAYINNYPISAYNLNNQTALYASGLRNYGFDVIWNEAERRVDISLSDEDIKGAGKMLYRDEKINAGRILSTAKETDIVTYINGEKVESYNIDGYTVIYLKELNRFGTVNWDGEKRIASVTIDAKNMNVFENVPYKYDLTANVPVIENIVGEVIRQEIKTDDKNTLYKYNGKDFVLEQVAKYTLLMKKCGFVCLDDPTVAENTVAFESDDARVVMYIDGEYLCIKVTTL